MLFLKMFFQKCQSRQRKKQTKMFGKVKQFFLRNKDTKEIKSIRKLTKVLQKQNNLNELNDLSTNLERLAQEALVLSERVNILKAEL